MSNKTKEKIVEIYSDKEQIITRGSFLKKYSNRSLELFDVLLKLLDLKKDNLHRKILDFGCGTGRLLEKVKMKWPSSSCYGLDLVYNEYCSNNASFDYRTYDGKDFPQYGKFDVIFCTNALYHVPNKQQVINFFMDHLDASADIFITTKSESNLPNIETLFRNICNELRIEYSLKDSHITSFTRENGKKLLSQLVNQNKYQVDQIDLTSTLIIDNMEELKQYILSSKLWIYNNPNYLNLLDKKLSNYPIFFDLHKETIFHISSRVR